MAMAPDEAALLARYATFAVVGIGAVGCVAAGLLADRLGRTTITIAAMAVSGGCALTVGFLFGGDPRWLIALCLVWGIAVVADSAQFSASIAELSERHLVGTMLTLQTSIGFTLTLLTIHLMPWWIDTLGWAYAFAPLAIGPVLGVIAMARLRANPDARKLAGGRR
jgi:MFS family permease